MKHLILRTSDKNRCSYNGFQWPESGLVEAPDWDPTPVCGNGLHGALCGEGVGGLFNWNTDAVWQVVEVEAGEIVDLGGKVKFPKGNVIYSGSREEATKIIQDRYPNAAVIGGTATAGDYGTATAGYRGTATAGDGGTATAGDEGTATAGDRGTAMAGDVGTATAGAYGTATAGAYGEIRIRWWDGNRYRLAVGYVGEDGIQPNIPYVVQNGKLIKRC